ncbi:Uncharacterized protein dnm_071970 [Desulfonema magnum]|uniref:Uncharacterized protein n=1 Tax=Desulfonema magnum TaxID=45655 RepID=A0A975BT54_9BACT|nr:Uncharacterized protein dnm_071970 [Desulfonema magnum]
MVGPPSPKSVIIRIFFHIIHEISIVFLLSDPAPPDEMFIQP